MVTGRYSRLLRSGTDEMTHFHTKRNRRRRALEYVSLSQLDDTSTSMSNQAAEAISPTGFCHDI